MSDKKRFRVADYVEHIVDAITRIETYLKGVDRDLFVKNSLLHDAVVRNFEIIGEAANNIKNIDGDFMRRHPSLPIDEAYRMRNALAHGYYTVNLLTVWNAVQNDLPALKKQLQDIQKALEI